MVIVIVIIIIIIQQIQSHQWWDGTFSYHDNCNGPGESKEYPALLVHRQGLIYSLFPSNCQICMNIYLKKIYEHFNIVSLAR